jgi:hypothetical protein
VQVFILHGLAPNVLLVSQIRYEKKSHKAATYEAKPPTPQKGWGTRKRKSPKWAALNFDRKADPSLVRRADSLVMTTFFGSSESVTLRMNRERDRGN